MLAYDGSIGDGKSDAHHSFWATGGAGRSMSLRNKLRFVGLSDTGKVREHNEDTIAVAPDIGLLVLADGMGGYNAGEVASGALELDRVLGGGIVPGSVILLGGDPGIGKSTLLLQVAAHIAASHGVLYASGEESAAQVGLRARRLSLAAAAVSVVAETELAAILALAAERRAALLVIDSIQTVQSGTAGAPAGAVSQLRECTAELVRFAKASGTAVIIVGHVTKEGTIAGPRLLEHLVDTVLYFEHEAGSRYRIVRAT